MKKLYTLMACTLLSAGLTFTSCENMLDQVNPNKQTEDTFWRNETDFELALTSCYTPSLIPQHFDLTLFISS